MERNNQAHWIPLADLMTGLMMVFMLIAAAFMLRVEQTTTLVVKEYQETKDNLVRALQEEFKQNLKQWHAEILGDMTIRFKDPDILFDVGSATIKPGFKAILKDFIPRYIKVVTAKEYKASIKEIRIEGHTSKRWISINDELTAYIKNMRLSQDRAQSGLEYILSLPAVEHDQKWIREHLTANGFSSSKPVTSENGNIDEARSQRLEFRIVTNADERMQEIAKQITKTHD